ncbi:MAG: hypothetical protein OXC40_04480 [Proteobacteria bacterium]|nr:hypothetical protein [Pseudomonadota bacterium]
MTSSDELVTDKIFASYWEANIMIKMSKKTAFDWSSGCDVVLDLLSQKLHHTLDIEYSTLIPILYEVKKEFFLRSASKPICLNQSIAFHNKVLVFDKKNLVWQLFHAMIQAPELKLTRAEIVRQVYGADIHNVSSRKRDSLLNSVSKLISRTRKTAESLLDQPSSPEWHWFVYELPAREYILIKPRLKVIENHLD